MTGNMMPGDNSGAEPKEHYRLCRTLCEYADTPLDDQSLWPIDEDGDHFCPLDHDDHQCNCDDIAESEIDWD